MPGHTCVVCGNTPTPDPVASFHHLPSDPARRVSWLDAFGLGRDNSKSSHECVVASSSLWELSSRYRVTTTSMLVYTAWDSNGSLRVAPGISVAVRVTETGHKELLHVGLLVSRRHRGYHLCSRPQF